MPSLLVQECGLKLNRLPVEDMVRVITPRAGVRIETPFLYYDAQDDMPSLLVQECGLKLINHVLALAGTVSLLVQECGLKHGIDLVILNPTISLLVQECGLKL